MFLFILLNTNNHCTKHGWILLTDNINMGGKINGLLFIHVNDAAILVGRKQLIQKGM